MSGRLVGVGCLRRFAFGQHSRIEGRFEQGNSPCGLRREKRRNLRLKALPQRSEVVDGLQDSQLVSSLVEVSGTLLRTLGMPENEIVFSPASRITCEGSLPSQQAGSDDITIKHALLHTLPPSLPSNRPTHPSSRSGRGRKAFPASSG